MTKHDPKFNISQTRSGNKVIFEVELEDEGSLLECEERIQAIVNNIGSSMTADAIKKRNPDEGSQRLQVGPVLYYSKGLFNESYQTPYGIVKIERFVYQTSEGGRTYCPLEDISRMVNKSTPKFAKQLSSKYARMSAREVVDDLGVNHGRKIARSFLQDIVCTVGAELEVAIEQEDIDYTPQIKSEDVHAISYGLDGAIMPMKDDGWREAMTGTVSFFDKDGNRIETIYTAAAPEYGKDKFREQFNQIAAKAHSFAPQATIIGLADGASWNWKALEGITDIQMLDFYHVTEYLAKAAKSLFPKNKKKKDDWLDESCHNLKHRPDEAEALLKYMTSRLESMTYQTERKETLQSVVTYFENGKEKMNYASNTRQNFPIGSGITEAACKIIVKQRMCRSGSKWRSQGAGHVLALRCMSYAGDRWNKFWENR